MKMMKQNKVLICLEAIFLSLYFSAFVFAQNPSGKCEIYSKETGAEFEDEEQVIGCPDAVTYSHRLYKFSVVLPANWSKIYHSKRKSEDHGKIVSIAFIPKEDFSSGVYVAMFNIIMQKSKDKNIEKQAKENINLSKTKVNGFKLESEVENTKIASLDAAKFIFSSNSTARTARYIIYNGGFVYELNFACDSIDAYRKYLADFDKILQHITIEKQT